jgi:oligopeptide/dipeptide ABC transporter ATP-binding protein
VLVLYSGQLAEHGFCADIVETPQHPYTRALVAAVPVPDPRHRRAASKIKGDAAIAINPPSGCRFAPRCPYAQEVCRRFLPEARMIKPGQWAHCHFVPIEPTGDKLEASEAMSKKG